ncbi:hypothetical protein BRADI_4g06360v3 [Brachypodium distachyon]|uniref:Uncharacterized protein n=1 Tax=Brachypodium distachyon TaxID=15368 RepID=I1II24_BRADI|nr:hypothetical protein BRADI_4g06360v3 [Brachypodium distachyon]
MLLAFPVAVSTVGELSANQLDYAVELVKRAKEQVDTGYMQSVAGLMHGAARAAAFHVGSLRTYVVTNVTKAGFRGAPVYGGPVITGIWGSFFLPSKGRGKGEDDGIVVPVCLPTLSMDKFVEEIGKLLRPAIKSAIARLVVNGISLVASMTRGFQIFFSAPRHEMKSLKWQVFVTAD